LFPLTAILEVIVKGIGYVTERDSARVEEVANVAGKMAEIVRRYRSEIAVAVRDLELQLG
jgi:hypothetical protein